MHLDAVNVSSECFYVKHAFHVITRRAAGSDIASLITQLVVLAIYPPDFFRMGTAVPTWFANGFVEELERDTACQSSPFGLRFEHAPPVVGMLLSISIGAAGIGVAGKPLFLSSRTYPGSLALQGHVYKKEAYPIYGAIHICILSQQPLFSSAFE